MKTKKAEVTREEWLARCAMAYDVGLVTTERLELMARWLNVVLQEGHSRISDRHHVPPTQSQQQNSNHLSSPPLTTGSVSARWEKVDAFWNAQGGELERLEHRSARMYHAANDHRECEPLATLANDVDGYALIQLAAIFTHPCQRCATDRGTWWTRPDCCQHRSHFGTARDRSLSYFPSEYDSALITYYPEASHKARS